MYMHAYTYVAIYWLSLINDIIINPAHCVSKKLACKLIAYQCTLNFSIHTCMLAIYAL